MSCSGATSLESYHENLREWAADWDLTEEYLGRRVFFIHPPHGSNVVCIDAEAVRKTRNNSFIQDCDGLVTGLHGESSIVLTVKTADCAPIFLFDPVSLASGIVHCGWRGLHPGLSCTHSAGSSELNADPASILLHIGPYISAARYEVGQDVGTLFPQHVVAEHQRLYLDIGAVVRQQALSQGVEARNMSDSRLCTHSCDDLSSLVVATERVIACCCLSLFRRGRRSMKIVRVRLRSADGDQ